MGDPWYTQYVKDLMQASSDFKQWWQRHDVCNHFDPHRQLLHPIVGELSLEVITLYANGDPDLRLCIYMEQPESDTAEKLHKLAAMEFT